MAVLFVVTSSFAGSSPSGSVTNGKKLNKDTQAAEPSTSTAPNRTYLAHLL